jgi:diguanylate cyclase (GGDEF)-like protein/PAS domain S-box-containing protein
MRQVSGSQGEASHALGQAELASVIEELEAISPKLAAKLAGRGVMKATARQIASNCFIEALSDARVGIVHRQLDGTIIAVNDYFCHLVGHSREALETSTLRDYSHPDDAEAFTRLGLQKVARAEPFSIEHRYVRPDGGERRCVVHVTFPRDPDGSVTSSIAVVLDVTAHRQAEEELRESEAHYRHSVELAPQISWTAAPDGSILHASKRWAEVTGTSQESALGHGWMAALREEDLAPTVAAWDAALRSRQPVDVEYRLRAPDGTDRWFRARAAPRLGPAGEVVRWYGTLEDIDDRKRTEQALRESEERFRLAAQAAGLGIWDFDAIHQRREWSGELKEMLGLPRDADSLVSTAMELVVPEDRHLLAELMEAVHAGDSERRFEVLLRIHRADNGEERWMQTGGWRIEAPGGQLGRVLVTIMDVTEQRNAAEQIRWTANHDALTRLPNRAFFGEQLEAAIGRAGEVGSSLALILFDIDNLKETNDTIGHDAGDSLLQTFAQRLQESLGDRACLARFGGDEFAAFLEVNDEREIVDQINASLRQAKREFECDGVTLVCGATAGATLYPRDGRTAKELLKTADIALYAGKAGQKGMLSIFKPEMRAHVQRRASMLAVARHVISEDLIVPFYQAKTDLATGRPAGFEALMRWRHDVSGLLGPDHLAAAFHDVNLATALSECMLDRVCVDIRRWLDMGLEFGRIAVNISPAEFRREDMFDRIMARLYRDRVSPDLLELEVTESVFMGRRADAVGDVLKKFHREGISIALDDFGTGYASLTHLQAFPIDIIKIDRSFVTNLAPDSANAAIVDAIIGLASRLGMDVIAEGIEAQSEAEYLREHGCAFGQGFFFSRPMGRDAVERLLAEHRLR